MSLRLIVSRLLFTAFLLMGIWGYDVQAQTQNTFVYVNNNTNSDTVSGFQVGPTGVLTQLPGSPYSTGGNSGGVVTFGMPDSITIAGQFLYAVNASSSSRTVAGFSIDPTTGVLSPVPGSPFVTGSLGEPISVQATPSGRFLYVADLRSGVITRYAVDRTDGRLTTLGTSSAGTAIVYSMRVTPDGRYLLVGTGQRRIAVLSINPSNGDLTPVSGSPFTPNLPQVVTSIDVDRLSSFVFAGTFTGTSVPTVNVNVFKLASTGALMEIPGSPFTFTLGGEATLTSSIVRLSPDGRFLYVGNYHSSTITVLAVAKTGELSLVNGSPFDQEKNAGRPVSLATNREGTLLFTGNNNFGSFGTIGVMTLDPATGIPTNNVSGNPFPTNQRDHIPAIAVFPQPIASNVLGRTYVADTANSRVQQFDGTAWTLAPVTSGVVGAGPGQFRFPEAVTASAAGNIYVADTGNNRIQFFNGSVWTDFATPGGGLNQVIAPQGLALDVAGQFLFVADTGNSRILRFPANSPGAAGTVLATLGSGIGQVRGPRGLAIDRTGTLFVADTGNNQVMQIPNATTVTTANTGTPVATFGVGIAPAQVRSPEGVAVDDGGTLYIADTGNNRVLQLSGGLPGPATVLTFPGSALGQTIAPEGVAVTALPSGQAILIGDTGNNRIQLRPAAGGIWTTAFGLPGQSATLGSGIGQFRSPSKIR